MSARLTNTLVPARAQTGDIRPEDLPHGLLLPPVEIRERLAQEKTRHAPTSFTPAVELRTLIDWTLAYYFDQLGHEVLYQSTETGPLVVAVGVDEILASRRALTPAEQRTLETWLPY